MITVFKNGEVFHEGKFHRLDLLIANDRIEAISPKMASLSFPSQIEVLDCEGLSISPGLIDPHQHLAGGSGENGGFSSQSSEILLTECIDSGITTVVGTLGADTVTVNMPHLLSRVKAFNELGLTAFAYTGGYDVPTMSLTGSVKSDIILIQEIIGVGEIAIADERAPEPSTKDLARSSVDAYVAGMLTAKAGVTHFHVGKGEKRLQSVRELISGHTIKNEHLYMTHIERSKELVKEGIELARKGCYLDFDIHDEDLHKWFKYYREVDGPMKQLTVSSDAGDLSPRALWEQVQDCVLHRGIKLEDLLPLFTENPSRVLKLKKKGTIEVGKHADFAIFDSKTLELTHVMAGGKFFLKDGKYAFKDKSETPTRDVDSYEAHGENKKG